LSLSLGGSIDTWTFDVDMAYYEGVVVSGPWRSERKRASRDSRAGESR
jgi:hypothetical protein